MLVTGCTVQVSAQQPTPASGHIDFDRDIRPILSDKCFACHGPDAANNKSKLRFDTEAHAFADLGNGRRAIVPGDPKQSQLVRRITAENAALRMPPVYSGLKLSKQEIDRLTEWIAQGAPWQPALGIHPAEAADRARSKEWQLGAKSH